MNKTSILFFVACLCGPVPASGQVKCDTSAIAGLIRQSEDFLFDNQFERAITTALDAFNTALQCKADAPLLERAFFQADDSYCLAAQDYITRGMFSRSIDLSERNMALHRQMTVQYPDRLALTYRNLGAALNLSDQLNLALEAFEKGLKLGKEANPGDPKLASYYEFLVMVSTDLHDTLAARNYLREWGSFHQKIGKKATMQARLNLASAWSMFYAANNDLNNAIKVLEDTLSVYGEKIRARGGFLGIAEFHLCEMLARAGRFEKSFSYSEKSIENFESRLQKQKGRLFSRTHYAWSYAQSARSAWNLFLQTRDTSWRFLAEKRCEKAEQEIFAMRDRNTNDGFRDWIANELGLTANITEVRQGLYHLTGNLLNVKRAFEVQEAFKVFAVQAFLHDTHALLWGGLPDTLYQREIAYRQQINDLETNFFMVRNHPDADSLIAANDQELFRLRDEYRQFLYELEQEFPVYFRLKYQNYSIQLEAVQQRILQKNQCLLDLFIENGYVFAMLIRPDTVVWHSAPAGDELWNAIDLLQQETRQFSQYQNLPEQAYLEHLKAYAGAAHQVYQALIAPVRPMLTEEVLLVPREQLAAIPFGALLTQPETQLGKPHLWHYLDQELIISQAYSAGFFDLIQQRIPARKPAGAVLALAPFFENESLELTTSLDTELRNRLFKSLPNSGAEVEAIAGHGKSKILLGAEASKENLLAVSADYTILHLATHSVANAVQGEYSFVALHAGASPNAELLYAREVYNLRLSADLVVLSACETGQGQFRKDEGIVGLSQAFACAGAKNVVASLWSVNDASTKDLMILFYRELDKGTPYNRALANAKRSFIKQQKAFAHPYFWAGFVLHGR